ncbi:hypothetical protein [Peribacillus simplex]|uniref:hypothetical protein n=1 Tax=Peribacillus simplex TaxID=1478 RepID=UPI00366FDC4A
MAPLDYNVNFIKKNRITDVKDYHTVSHERWKNAVNCYKNDDYLAALYLAGYSVECILKYAIFANSFSTIRIIDINSLKRYRVDGREFKALGTHQIAELINLGNSKNVFKTPKEADYKDDVILWKAEWRYATNHNIDKQRALIFLNSAVKLSEQLKAELTGITRIRSFEL